MMDRELKLFVKLRNEDVRDKAITFMGDVWKHKVKLIRDFEVTYVDDYEDAQYGTIYAVTDYELNLIGVFAKHEPLTYREVVELVREDSGETGDIVLFDITGYTGLDYNMPDYFKGYEGETDAFLEEPNKDSDELSKYTCFSNPFTKERFDDALEENYTKTSTGYIRKDDNRPKEQIEEDKDLPPSLFSTFLQSHRRNVLSELAESNRKNDTSDNKRLGFSGAIKRAQERNNAKKENSKADKEDAVNQPSHYTSGDIEVIEYIEQQAKVMYESGTVPPEVIPHICNAIKYISRFQSKGKPVEDLNKSIYYINRAIKKIEDGD